MDAETWAIMENIRSRGIGVMLCSDPELNDEVWLCICIPPNWGYSRAYPHAENRDPVLAIREAAGALEMVLAQEEHGLVVI